MTAQSVFISYSHQDDEFVLRLARELETRGVKVWIDRGDIHAGAQWRAAIHQAIEEAQAFFLVISPDALRSEYVSEEFALAEQLHKPIFPLIYRKTKIEPALQERLFGYQFVDFRQGGYRDKFTDLLTGLKALGLVASDAPELSEEELQARRLELLGAPDKTRWKEVFQRVPGWAFSWGIGWAFYWLLLPLILAVLGASGGDALTDLWAFPVGGFVGGLGGGLWAGLATMLALRHHADSIAWKHMRAAVRIWGLVGPLGTIIAGWLAGIFFQFSGTQADCTGLAFGDCLNASLGQLFADVISAIFLLVLLILLYVLGAVFGIGCVSGWLAVRHIRRLEPGILGKQAVWVVLGWGSGAVGAFLLSVLTMAWVLPG